MAASDLATHLNEKRTKPDAAHAKVAEMTRQLFGGDVSIRLEPDPEVPINYFVVYAEARGEVEELVKLDHQWHRLLGETVGPGGERYCLSLV
jgi:hypothetical protein